MASIARKLAMALGIALGCAAFLGIVYLTAPQAPVAAPDLSRDKPTANGLFWVAIEPEAGEFRQGELHAWIATVKTAQGQALEGADIKVDGGMPAHNHGLPTSPQVTAYLGDGRYRIEGVKFSMGGAWEFRLAVTAEAGTDNVTFNLML